MERIEAVELLNTHFFADTSKCREAWYSIRAELVESVPFASYNSASNAISASEAYCRKHASKDVSIQRAFLDGIEWQKQHA